MADIKKIKSSLKDAGDIANALVVVSSALAILQPAANVIANTLKDKVEERKDLVSIPELYTKDIPMKLDRAKILLEECGFKVEPIAIREANIKYKDCFDLQIVGSKPKHKQKVKPGTIIFLKYVTSEIIEESKKMFDLSEKHRAEIKLEKAKNRSEQKEKNRKIVDDVTSSIQERVMSVAVKKSTKSQQENSTKN